MVEPFIRDIATLANVENLKGSRPQGQCHIKEVRKKWNEMIMEAKEKAGVYERYVRRHLMESTTKYFHKFLRLNGARSWRDVSLSGRRVSRCVLYIILTYDIPQNLYLDISVRLGKFLMRY